jgi:uncharacterized protein (TIGR00251 family)
LNRVAAPESILRIRVKPNAKTSGLVGRHGDAIKITVRAAPERGRANDEVLNVLAGVLQLPTSALELVAGPASPDKRVRVHGLDARIGTSKRIFARCRVLGEAIVAVERGIAGDFRCSGSRWACFGPGRHPRIVGSGRDLAITPSR